MVIATYAAFWFGFWSDHYDKALVPVSSYFVFMYAYVPLAVGVELYRSLRAEGKGMQASVHFAIGFPTLSSVLIFSLRALVLSFSGLGDVEKVVIRVTVPLYCSCTASFFRASFASFRAYSRRTRQPPRFSA